MDENRRIIKASEHADWATAFFRWVYFQAFKHGYKHGYEDALKQKEELDNAGSEEIRESE